MKLLIINPGGTSTKIAVFEDEEQVLKKNIIHTQEELSGFSHVFDQFGYRKGLILKTLEEEGVDIHELSGVAGRGGLMNPIPGGTYRVNERMLEDLEHAVHGEHPSNLGAALARSIGDQIGVPSFVVDPVSVDELMPKARISGISDLERPSWFHALNHKAVARWAAERIGKKYEESSLIIAHLGSGNSVVAHKNGQMIDGSGGRTNGPFLRSGAADFLPTPWWSCAIPENTPVKRWWPKSAAPAACMTTWAQKMPVRWKAGWDLGTRRQSWSMKRLCTWWQRRYVRMRLSLKERWTASY